MTATGVRKALQKLGDLSEGPDVIGDSGGGQPLPTTDQASAASSSLTFAMTSKASAM